MSETETDVAGLVKYAVKELRGLAVYAEGWDHQEGQPFADPQAKRLVAAADAIQSQAAEVARLRGEVERLQQPQWFYDANGDQESACFDVGEVVEGVIDWGFGNKDYHAPHLIEVSTARPLPSIWVVARAYTDAEKDARDDDEPYEIRKFATEAEAKAAYAALAQRGGDDGQG